MMSLLFILIFYLYPLPASGQIANFTTKISFATNATTCLNCCEGLQKVSDYLFLASSGIGEYFQDFNDFLPEGWLLKQVFINLRGTFHLLSPTQKTVLSVLITTIAVTTDYKITPWNCINPQCCGCRNCHYSLTLPTQSSGELWPLYNYSGVNQLQFILTSNAIAISEANLVFTAVNVIPKILSLSPESLPMNGSSGQLLVHGSNFLNYFNYVCQWKEKDGKVYQTQANPGNSTYLECPPPTEEVQTGLVNFTVFANLTVLGYNAQAISEPVPFNFYREPVINDLIPSSGNPKGGDFVVVNGQDFFNSSTLLCRFGDRHPTEATWLNKSAVGCVAPAMAVQKIVKVAITENGFDYTNGVAFTYASPINPGLNFFWIIIVSCLCFVFVLMIIGVYVIYRLNSDDTAPKINLSDVSGSTIDFEELSFKERIGGGSFGVVYRGYWRYSEIAIKQLPIHAEVPFETLMSEANLMGTMRHPNVTQLMGVCLNHPDMFIITEYISRGSLFKVLHLPEDTVTFEKEHIRHFALDTCKGMAYIHALQIMHRDLKSSNLLVDKDWNIKEFVVSDFGLSRLVSDVGNTMTACGTPSWAAPEVLRNMSYSFQADVFSFAVSLWEMVTRKYPYDGQPPYHVVIAVATKGARPEIPPDADPKFVELMVLCWDEDPNNRPSFGELVMRLSRNGISKTCISVSKNKESRSNLTEVFTGPKSHRRRRSDSIP